MALINNNINNYVYIRLTNYGRQIHEKNHHEFWSHHPIEIRPMYVPPHEDGNGWSKWQLWHLMYDFGSTMGMGVDIPFETAIRMEVDGDSVVQLWDLRLTGKTIDVV